MSWNHCSIWDLIKGGDLDNAIVILEKEVEQSEIDRIAKLFNRPGISTHTAGILNNTELRYPNEPARHKLLDIMGDIALVGHPDKRQDCCNPSGPLCQHKTCKDNQAGDEKSCLKA